MKKIPRVFVTNHAVDRFKQRFFRKCIDVDPRSALLNEFSTSIENNTHRNNTKFMVDMYEKYGYGGDYSFRVNDQIVFVCKNDKLLTVYPKKGTIFDTNGSSFKKRYVS